MAVAIALPVTKECPHCGSEKTTAEPRTNLRKLITATTGLLNYKCAECGRAFHAGDRRRKSRSAKGAATIIRK